MTDITNIPLNKLTAWKGNVRKTQNKASLDELAASIKAHGLQQNLVVRKDGENFLVVAGGRRLKALQQLAKAGDIKATFAVPCRIMQTGDATEISLAENIMREDMHPADQFEAFRKLADKGEPAADIGARFGKSETHVMKLLKLSRVSPKILKAYRAGELALEDVMAFTVTDDHAAQERVFKSLGQWREPREIRTALTENDIAGSDKRVKFVTLKAYENAGGKIRRDLFSDNDSGIYLEDADVLDALVIEALEKQAMPIRAEGWKWVEVRPDFGYQESADYKRIHAAPVPLPAAEQKQLDSLQEKYDALSDQWNDSDDEEPPPRLDALEKRIAEIEDRDGVWTPEQLAMAGAIVSIDHQGKARIERGLVRPEDMPKKQTAKSRTAGNTDADEEQPAGLSAALAESLTAQKSAALGAWLMQRPDVALAALAHALILDIHDQYRDADTESCLEVSGVRQSLHRVEGSKAFCEREQADETWGDCLPGNPDDLWTWCLEQPQTVLLDVLAYCTACAVNTVCQKQDNPANGKFVSGDKLAKTLGLDMNAWFTPTAENYFNRVSKPQILAALTEARNQPPAPAWEKLKKSDLAKTAEREIAGSNWLPEILR